MDNITDMTYEDLDIPEYAFTPDEWVEAFQKGLEKYNFEGKKVHEVGLGTGINIIKILELGAQQVSGSDIDERLPTLARENVEKNSEHADKFKPILGSTSLLENEEITSDIDTVVACIPQAIRPPHAEEHADDSAHYYPAEPFQDYPYNIFALGLNEALLQQAKKRVPDAEVILNIGGRVGKEILESLFKEYEYETEILDEEIIPQHPGTSLEFFQDLEKELDDFECEFFSDEKGQTKINAEEAEQRRVDGDPVFHKIYVIKGTPRS